MKPSIQIIGVYPVPAGEPVHLVEMKVENNVEMIDLGDITQEWEGKEKSSWQVPYDERFLSEDGIESPILRMLDRRDPNFWNGDLRFAFFFHYLNFEKKLLTPWGELDLPAEEEKPERLDIEYRAP